METTRNALPSKLKHFLDKLKDYLDTPLYYYGSVQREDYVAGQSDIDVAIFTDNENSIISKMCHFLHVKRKEFKKIIIRRSGNIVYGYKIKYKTETVNDNGTLIVCEFAIYNTNFKLVLMDHYNKINNVPIFILFLLFILKQVYYVFPIISKKNFKDLKNYIFDVLYLNTEGRSFFILETD
jgi:hypothetical protein